MAEPKIEYVGGRGDSNGPGLAVYALLAAGVLVVLLAGILLGATVFRPELEQLSAQVGLTQPATSLTGEPEVTLLFVQAAARGDGPAMRRQVTQACIEDVNSALCFDATADAGFQRSVANFHPRFIYRGRAGDLVGYTVRLSNGQSLEIVFRLDSSTGKIAAQRVL